MANHYRRRNTLGTLPTRLRLLIAARRRGSVIRWPLRVPQAACPDPRRRIEIGTGTYVGARSWFSFSAPDGRISIGDDCVIGESFTISCGQAVRIGNGTLVSDRVMVIDQEHDAAAWVTAAARNGEAPRWSPGSLPSSPVTIGDGCWLGVNVVVLPGVRIGNGCVIGANAVVTGDVPDRSVAVGAPARVVRTLDDGLNDA